MKISATLRFESKREANQATAGHVAFVLRHAQTNHPWLSDDRGFVRGLQQMESLSSLGGSDDWLLQTTYDNLYGFLATARPPQSGAVVRFQHASSPNKRPVPLNRLLPPTLEEFQERYASAIDTYFDDAIGCAAEAVYMGECTIQDIQDEFQRSVLDTVFDEVPLASDNSGAVIKGDEIELRDDVPLLESYPEDRILGFMAKPDGALYNLLTDDHDEDCPEDGDADHTVIRTILEVREHLRDETGEIIRPNQPKLGLSRFTLGDLQRADAGTRRFAKFLMASPERETPRETRLRFASRIMKPRLVR